MDKYIPIPQWIWQDNRMIGVKDLYLVHTVESDYWIKEVNDGYIVYEADLQTPQIKCVSMKDAVIHIEEVSKANLYIWERAKKKEVAR